MGCRVSLIRGRKGPSHIDSDASFLGETCKEPAEIREAIKVTQNLRVGMLAHIKRRDPALGAAANRARHIERGSKRGVSGIAQPLP